MNYNIYISNELTATGLSRGELNQWILDLYRELDHFGSMSFARDLGWDGAGSFADHVYTTELELPLELVHGRDSVVIMEDEI